MRATDTPAGREPDGRTLVSVVASGWLTYAAAGADYFGAAGVEADGSAAEAAAFSSFAAAFRALIFACLIFGKLKTERPSGHSPRSMRWRTRSCRFNTLRRDPPEPPADRSDGWMDMG